MKDKGVCIAAADREENEKSSSKAAKTSQEMTVSSQEERETEEMKNGQKQRDEITRGSSIGTLPNKKDAKTEEITNEENKDTWHQNEARRRTDEEITGKSSSSNDSLPNEKETRLEKIAFTHGSAKKHEVDEFERKI